MRIGAVYSWVLRGIVGASSRWTTDAFTVFSAFLKKIARRTVFRTEQLYARYCHSINIPMRLGDRATTEQLSSVFRPTRRWTFKKRRLLQRAYNVDLLFGFVLGVVLTIVFSMVLRWSIAQLVQS